MRYRGRKFEVISSLQPEVLRYTGKCFDTVHAANNWLPTNCVSTAGPRKDIRHEACVELRLILTPRS